MSDATPSSPAIDALNAMPRDAFVAALGPAFERAPWVADAAYDARPFADADALHRAMLDVVRRAPHDTVLAFLRGHPDLAGVEARAGTMTDESVGEQAAAGLGRLAPHEKAALDAGNARYRERHGFPFIIAARFHDRPAILAALARRVDGDTAAEFDEALRQIGLITRHRIDALLASLPTLHGAPR